MDFLLLTAIIWLAGWFITTLVVTLVEPPDRDELPYVVFVPLFLWPLVMVILFPLYLFGYITNLRKRYL